MITLADVPFILPGWGTKTFGANQPFATVDAHDLEWNRVLRKETIAAKTKVTPAYKKLRRSKEEMLHSFKQAL